MQGLVLGVFLLLPPVLMVGTLLSIRYLESDGKFIWQMMLSVLILVVFCFFKFIFPGFARELIMPLIEKPENFALYVDYLGALMSLRLPLYRLIFQRKPELKDIMTSVAACFMVIFTNIFIYGG